MKFASRVNLSYVDQNSGVVEPRGLPVLANWNRSCNLERLLQVRRPLRMRMCTGANAFSALALARSLPHASPSLSCHTRARRLTQLSKQELRREMTSSQNRRNPQPPDGSMY